ncbi:hypothetical protein ACIJDO_001642 [Enterococcus hirae]
MAILTKAKTLKTKKQFFKLVEKNVLSKKNIKIYQLTEVNGSKKKSIEMKIPKLMEKQFVHIYQTILELDKQRQSQYKQVSYLKKEQMNRLNYLAHAKKLDVDPRHQETVEAHVTQRIEKLQDRINKNKEKLAKNVNFYKKYKLKKTIATQEAELASGKKLLETNSLETLKDKVSNQRKQFEVLKDQFEQATEKQPFILRAQMMPLINSFKGLLKLDLEYTDKLTASLEKYMELEPGNRQQKKAQLQVNLQKSMITKQNSVKEQPIQQANQNLNDKIR